ncbi:hypothetical protein ACP3V3_14760 [Vibrio sp. PNB22_3_1]
MNLTFNVERLLLPVTQDLQDKLEQIANQHDLALLRKSMELNQ